MLSIFALQFVFVTFGGEVLSVESLDARSWLMSTVMLDLNPSNSTGLGS